MKYAHLIYMVFQSVSEIHFSSTKGIKMFPEWAMCLLKYYDLCGFYTKMHNLEQKELIELSIFIAHILLAFYLSISIILWVHNATNYYNRSSTKYGKQSFSIFKWFDRILDHHLRIVFQKRSSNELLENLWAKSYLFFPTRLSSKSNKLFVQILWIYGGLFDYPNSFGAIFLVDCECISLLYHFVWSHRQMYQSRIFYLLFYIESIKHELKTIHKELMRIVLISQSNAYSCGKDTWRDCVNIMECFMKWYGDHKWNFRMVTICIDFIFITFAIDRFELGFYKDLWTIGRNT